MDLRDELRQLAGPIAEEEGYELVDVELVFLGRRKILRVLLDKPGGITVGECARVSRRLSDCLDMNQTVPGSYMLEVGSPGLDRPLRTLESIGRFAGSRAAVTLHEARDGRRNFEGVLLGPEGDRAGVRVDEGDEHWFDWAEIRSARLVVDPWAGTKRKDPGGKDRTGRRDGGRRPRGGADEQRNP